MRFTPLKTILHDERGGGTVFGLLWFALMVGICGLAVDITNGFRSRTALQATVDSVTLAAAIDLPDPGAVTASAVSYATDNLDAEINGSVLSPADVIIGKWDEATRTLDTSSAEPDAVMATVRQTEDNSNPVPVNFLRIIGLMTWDVQAMAVAQRFIPECLNDGLVARGIVDISSNNDFVNNICVHGQKGVHMQNHNYYELGVAVSMPDPDSMLVIPSVGMASNPGLPQALREDILDPRMVNHTDEIMAEFLDRTSPIIPAYINTNLPVLEIDEKFNLANAQPGRIYSVICAPNKNVMIPANSTVTDVIVIAECEIMVAAGATVKNVVLGSRSGGNPGQGQGGGVSSANIGVAANVQLGEPDNCTQGGGVQLFSNATIHISSSAALDGVQMVARGDVELGARDQGVNGISVQTGGNITLTSNNMFGLCSGGAPNLFTVPYYRLVL